MQTPQFSKTESYVQLGFHVQICLSGEGAHIQIGLLGREQGSSVYIPCMPLNRCSALVLPEPED